MVSKPNVTNSTAAWIATGSFLVILLLSVACALWAFRIMAPSDYAQVMISGQPTSEILQVIAHEIVRTCRKSLGRVAAFENEIMGIPRGEPGTRDHAEALELLEEQFARQHGSLLRISAMLRIASKESGIPLRRLRDLLFNYDPRLHVAYAKKYVHNAESIRELSEGKEITELDKSKAEKCKNLMLENAYIRQSAENAADSGIRLIEYAAIQPKILHLAAVHSTSQATKEYARAIAFIAKETIHATESQRDRWREQLEDGVAALKFLVRKQHTHSGFDLNQLCARACGIASEKAEILRSLGDHEMNKHSVVSRPSEESRELSFESKPDKPVIRPGHCC